MKREAPKPDAPFPPAFLRELGGWFAREGRRLPWRATRDPYAILVSEFMLQQTQVATVIPYFVRWMQRFPTVGDLAAADEQAVLSMWQGLGYYRRARNLHRAAKAVVERHGGAVPDSPDALRALPGVGAYTAGAVAAFAFDLPEPAVDANVARVLARMLDYRLPVGTRAAADRFDGIVRATLRGGPGRAFNSALMELGALVCIPREPRCGKCPVRRWCRAENPGALPAKAPRKKTVEMEERCAFIRSDKGFLLAQETGARWSGLWKLPPAGDAPGPVLVRLTYPFTHHRISLVVVRGPAPQKVPFGWRWFSDPASAPMPAPHRRAVAVCLAGSATQGAGDEGGGPGALRVFRDLRARNAPEGRCP